MKPTTRRLLFLLAALAFVVVAIVALRRGPIAPSRQPDVAEMLPRTCDAVVVVPELGRLGEHLAIVPRLKLAQLSATLADYPDAEAFFAEIVRQAGFDPRSRESLRAAGIDPSRAMVGFLSEHQVPIVAIPEADAAKLDALFTKNAANRMGATERSEKKVGDKTVIIAGKNQLEWMHAGGFTFLVQGQDGLDALAAIAAQKPADALANDPRYLVARQAQGGRDLFVFGCHRPSDELGHGHMYGLPYGVTLGVSLTERELAVAVDLPLSDEQMKEYQSLAQVSGADLVARLDPNAFLLARAGGDPALLKPLVDLLLPPQFQHALQEAGIDPKEQILGNLKPGAVLSLSLAPSAKMAVPALDVRRTNPFEYVFLSVLGRPADAAKAADTLKKAAAAAPRFGANIEERPIDGTPVYVTRYHLGEGASLALQGEYAIVTGGEDQMQAQLKRLSGAPALTIADAAAKRALTEDGAALFLDVGRLTSGVRALPDSAYGVGGFAIKAALSRWLDAVDEIAAVRAGARLADRTLHADLTLSLKLAPLSAQKDARSP